MLPEDKVPYGVIPETQVYSMPYHVVNRLPNFYGLGVLYQVLVCFYISVIASLLGLQEYSVYPTQIIQVKWYPILV
jgi:hypothetical protein